MGLRTGRKIKVWEIKDKGNYASCRCSTSSRAKDSDTFETDWSGFINFCGKAYEKVKEAGVNSTLIVGEFEVKTRYDKAKKREYTNYAMFTIGSEGDGSESSSASAKSKRADPAPAVEEPDTEEDPF